MKVKNLYIGKIDTIIKIKKTVTNSYSWITTSHGIKFVRIIHRDFSKRFCKYALLYYKNGKMMDVSDGKKYLHPEIIDNYRSKKLQNRNVVSDYFEASRLLPIDGEERVSRRKAKMLCKRLNYGDVEKRFNRDNDKE